MNYRIFDDSQVSYTKNIRSDLSVYRDKVLEEMKVGPITYSTESLQYTFSPQWLQWFKLNFTYNQTIRNKPLNSVLNAANINLNQNKSVNFAISPTEFIESFTLLPPRGQE